MSIETIKYRNIDATVLSFNNYEAVILNGRGCNVIDFKQTNSDLSFLHFPEDAELDEFARSPQRFGNAILFHPNKIENCRFVKNGITYDLNAHNIPGAHGIIKELPFILTETHSKPDGVYATFKFSSKDTPYYTGFRWDFNLIFEFELSATGLTQKMSFENIGDVEIPFGLGFHTSFRIPFDDRHVADDYKIFVSCGRRWEVDDRNYPSGKLIDLSADFVNSGVNPLALALSEHTTAVNSDFSALHSSLSDLHGAVIYDTVTDTKFVYETDPQFTNWMIWNNNASDNYVCIEPMTWIIDAPNAKVPDSVSGFRFVAPGNTWTAKNRLYVL